MSVATPPLTTADLLAMPDDGIRRRIYKGQLIEEGPYNPESEALGMTVRNRFHSIAMSNITGELYIWRQALPPPRGNLVNGEAAVQFTDDGDTIGVDVAYVPPGVMVTQTDDNTVIVGVPTLIVEILSPSTTQRALNDRLNLFDETNVPVVWIVDAERQTVTVHRHGQQPALVNRTQDLIGGPELPGFHVPVARLFE
jgi:Uma2 family endonuclease